MNQELGSPLIGQMPKFAELMSPDGQFMDQAKAQAVIASRGGDAENVLGLKTEKKDGGNVVRVLRKDGNDGYLTPDMSTNKEQPEVFTDGEVGRLKGAIDAIGEAAQNGAPPEVINAYTQNLFGGTGFQDPAYENPLVPELQAEEQETVGLGTPLIDNRPVSAPQGTPQDFAPGDLGELSALGLNPEQFNLGQMVGENMSTDSQQGGQPLTGKQVVRPEQAPNNTPIDGTDNSPTTDAMERNTPQEVGGQATELEQTVETIEPPSGGKNDGTAKRAAKTGNTGRLTPAGRHMLAAALNMQGLTKESVNIASGGTMTMSGEQIRENARKLDMTEQRYRDMKAHNEALINLRERELTQRQQEYKLKQDEKVYDKLVDSGDKLVESIVKDGASYGTQTDPKTKKSVKHGPTGQLIGEATNWGVYNTPQIQQSLYFGTPAQRSSTKAKIALTQQTVNSVLQNWPSGKVQPSASALWDMGWQAASHGMTASLSDPVFSQVIRQDVIENNGKVSPTLFPDIMALENRLRADNTDWSAEDVRKAALVQYMTEKANANPQPTTTSGDPAELTRPQYNGYLTGDYQ